MAVDVNNVKSGSTIAFTLPISCQICLGKVKSPLLCPNNHAFCSQCLEIWLERNKQCPACRTPINEENPCKEIRGGMSVVEEQESNSINTPELRRARFEMLFKDYESEMCLVEAKMEALKVENRALHHQLEVTKSSKTTVNPVSKEVNMDVLGAVTKKLQDVTHQFDKVKQEVQKFKKTNVELKEDNDLLLRENQRLRTEISSRSPHRYGRTTVAALQSQIDTYEKEVQQLNKALEKSDVYIEDLEIELSTFRGKDDTASEEQRTKVFSTKKFQGASLSKASHKKQLFKDETDTGPSESSGVNTVKSGSGDFLSPQKVKHVSGILVTGNKDSGDSPTKGGKKVTFSLPQDDTPQGSQASSFDLEYPSPLAKSPSSGPDREEHNPSIISQMKTSVGSICLPVNQNVSKSQKTEVTYSSEPLSARHAGQKSSDMQISDRDKKVIKTLDDIIDIETELDDLDISVTPEFKDCMKLFSMAERNVQQRSSLANSSTTTDAFLEQSIPVAKTEPQINHSSTDQFQFTIPGITSSTDYLESGRKQGKDPLDFRNDASSSRLESNWKQGTDTPDFKNDSSNNNVKKCSVPLVRVSNVTEFSQTKSISGLKEIPRSQTSSIPSGTHSNSGSYVSHDKRPKSNDNFAVPRGVESSSKSYSGSVVSSILGSNAQTATKHSSSTSEPSTSFFPQSQSSSSTSTLGKVGTGGSIRPGVYTSTASSSEFSQSLLLNSQNTESLANSLKKLEQTLAAHRASSISMPNPSSYQIPGAAKSVTATSSILSSALPPPLPSQTGTNLSSVPSYGSTNPHSVKSLNALNPSYHNIATSRYSVPAYMSSNSTLNSGTSLNTSYNNTISTYTNTTTAWPQSSDVNRLDSVGSHQHKFHVPQSYPSATALSNSILNGYSFPLPSENQTFPSHLPTSASNTTSSVYNPGGTKVLAPPSFPVSSSLDLEKPNNFSYVSNFSLNSNDMSSLDNSFLPEPKKRLFETDTDDTDMSFSPSKSSKLR